MPALTRKQGDDDWWLITGHTPLMGVHSQGRILFYFYLYLPSLRSAGNQLLVPNGSFPRKG